MSEFKLRRRAYSGALVLFENREKKKRKRFTVYIRRGWCISDFDLRLLSPFFPALGIKQWGVGVVVLGVCIHILNPQVSAK